MLLWFAMPGQAAIATRDVVVQVDSWDRFQRIFSSGVRTGAFRCLSREKLARGESVKLVLRLPERHELAFAATVDDVMPGQTGHKLELKLWHLIAEHTLDGALLELMREALANGDRSRQPLVRY